MKAVNPAFTSGFVLADDDGEPFWFLNTLTITKVGTGQSQGQLSIVDHRMPPGFAPPPHIHQQTDEALLVLDGQLQGFCGDSGVERRARLAGVPAARHPARLHRL